MKRGLLFWFLFLVCLFWRYPDFYKARFDREVLVTRYLKSQDIFDPQERIKDRIFISDSEIYLASGYLYTQGASPSEYNFQHPPLLKYLYGYSLRFLGSPVLLQLILSGLLFVLAWQLGISMGMKVKTVSWALVMLAVDPLVAEVTSHVYLDLGLAVLGLGFVLTFIYFPKKQLISGIFLGLFLAAKFWSVSLFIFGVLSLYRFYYLKNLRFTTWLKIIGVALLIYTSTYWNFFIRENTFGDFLWLQAKMVKFMLTHNAVAVWGGEFWLFLTGFYLSWWDKGGLMKTDIFWPVWPVAFFFLIVNFSLRKAGKKLWLPMIVVLSFFLINFRGAPFARYLIFVLPYFYLSLSAIIGRDV